MESWVEKGDVLDIRLTWREERHKRRILDDHQTHMWRLSYCIRIASANTR